MKPSFSIEKPIRITIDSPLVGDTRYISQLKIDEHRSFLIYENNALTVLGWRGNIHHIFKEFEIKGVRSAIFDGGVIRTLEFKTNPLIYAFDVLMLEGQKLSSGYIDRYQSLSSLGVERFIIPENISDTGDEYRRILGKNSLVVQRFAERAGVSNDRAYQLCEGLVLKDRSGVLRYPASLSYNTSQFKLKLPNR